jgi:hypothetical protein
LEPCHFHFSPSMGDKFIKLNRQGGKGIIFTFDLICTNARSGCNSAAVASRAHVPLLFPRNDCRFPLTTTAHRSRSDMVPTSTTSQTTMSADFPILFRRRTSIMWPPTEGHVQHSHSSLCLLLVSFMVLLVVCSVRIRLQERNLLWFGYTPKTNRK